MEQVLEKENTHTTILPNNGRLGMEAKKKMTAEEQSDYIKLHKAEILERVKALEERLSKCEVLISDEDEIVELVSKYRRERYEKSHRN